MSSDKRYRPRGDAGECALPQTSKNTIAKSRKAAGRGGGGSELCLCHRCIDMLCPAVLFWIRVQMDLRELISTAWCNFRDVAEFRQGCLGENNSTSGPPSLSGCMEPTPSPSNLRLIGTPAVAWPIDAWQQQCH